MQDITFKSCKNSHKKAKSRKNLQDFYGADGRIRTGDLILTKDAGIMYNYESVTSNLYLFSALKASYIRELHSQNVYILLSFLSK